MKAREYRPVVVKGGYGYGNFGDDALMVAVHGAVGRISAKIGYLCNPASYLHKLVPSAEILALSEKDNLAAGMLVFGGGTQFFSFPRTHAKSYYSLSRRIARLVCHPQRLPASVVSKTLQNAAKRMPNSYDRLAALGIGVGPFVEHSIEEGKARDLFVKMDFVAVRDVKSYQLCQSWGAKNLHQYADLCFWPEFQKEIIPNDRFHDANSVRRVGIIVRDWPHDDKGDAYSDSILEVAAQLIRMGKHIDFVLFSGVREKIWRRRLRLGRFGHIFWDPQNDSLAGFTSKLAQYDLFITARFHGAVFATLLEKPAICIGIEKKLELFADVLGEGGRCWRYPFDRAECLRLVEEVEEGYSHVTNAIRRVRHEQTLLCEQMVNQFSNFVRTWGICVPT